MSFINALTNTLAIEGGYANDPNDTGGETYRGISRVHHPKWPGWKIIDACKHSGIPLASRELLTSMVNAFYHDEFWIKAGCNIVDAMSEPVAEELFEASVNCGRGNGVKFLQRALNVLNVNATLYPDIDVDGVLGHRETIPALRACLRARVAERLIVRCQNGEQYIYYRSLPQSELYRGWYART